VSALVAFGAGGDEPYALLLGGPEGGRLALRRVGEPRATLHLDVTEWRSPASRIDRDVLGGLSGPLLDVGCGPGRMVRAAQERGLAALGVDISAQAATHAAADGTPVLLRSVFERLPLEGRWESILLMDGNIGIGGDPHTLLRRCAQLLAPEGNLLVEVDVDPDLHDCAVYTAVDANGLESDAFPWARVGSAALVRIASECGLVADAVWAAENRRFVLLRTTRDPR
jgi:SAM-dependent methyltransferase